MDIIKTKFFEVLSSVLPITIISIILNFTLTPLGMPLFLRLIVGASFIIIGLTIFLFGIEIGIDHIGNFMGALIAKTNKVYIVVIAGLILGFFVSVAEPDLQILAQQVSFVTDGMVSKMSIVFYVSTGIAFMLSVGLIRIVYNFPLYKLLMIVYSIIFLIALITSKEFLAISFDSSGATTGALTVPFILSIGHGVATLKKDSKASEKDSFGLVAIASTGAIISVMLMSIFLNQTKLKGNLDISTKFSNAVFEPFFNKIWNISIEILIALIPILLIYMLCLPFGKKFNIITTRHELFNILKGILYTFIGLVFFLTGVNGGFLDVGIMIGYKLASLDSPLYLVGISFVLGLTTILAEPAVYILTRQIEEVTSGYIKRIDVTLALSIGVAISVSLSMVRILIPQVQLWHYLLPGYLICLTLMYISPKLFVGIGFDAGGVASGPMTATFILAFAQGAAQQIVHANVLIDGFGIIAMVAMTPIITLQILGVVYKIKSAKGGIS